MSYAPTPEAEATLRRHAQRLQWGLLLYLLVLLAIGIEVVRLASTTRRFERTTVLPMAQPPVESLAGGEGSADGTVVPVSSPAP